MMRKRLASGSTRAFATQIWIWYRGRAPRARCLKRNISNTVMGGAGDFAIAGSRCHANAKAAVHMFAERDKGRSLVQWASIPRCSPQCVHGHHTACRRRVTMLRTCVSCVGALVLQTRRRYASHISRHGGSWQMLAGSAVPLGSLTASV